VADAIKCSRNKVQIKGNKVDKENKEVSKETHREQRVQRVTIHKGTL